jgi:hypothetical protein
MHPNHDGEYHYHFVHRVTGNMAVLVPRQTDSTGKTPAPTALPRSLPIVPSAQTTYIPARCGPGLPHQPPCTDTPAWNILLDPNA